MVRYRERQRKSLHVQFVHLYERYLNSRKVEASVGRAPTANYDLRFACS